MHGLTLISSPLIGVLMVGFCAFTPRSNDGPSVTGRGLYTTNCARCHGEDGAKCKWGAFDLRKSRKNETAIADRIRSGKGIMPSFKNKLSEQEITAVSRYVKTLRAQ